MRSMLARSACSALVLLVLLVMLGSTRVAQAQAAPAAEPPAPPAGEQTAPRAPSGTLQWGTEPSTTSDIGGKARVQKPTEDVRSLPFRGSTAALDQSVSTQTVGVGSDPQTHNPSYDMTLLLRPRYYLYQRPDWDLSVRAELGLFREFTNSDVTTERGETSLTDAQLFMAYLRPLYQRGRYRTELLVRAPLLTLPTSKVSANNGMIAGLGGSLGLTQIVPLASPESPVFRSGIVALRAGYSHTFTDAIVPTSDNLARVRTDPEGRLLYDDQLTGVAFAQHEASIRALFQVDVLERLTLGTAVGWRPYWKYDLPDTEICNLPTGCVEPGEVEDPQRYGVITTFEADVSWYALSELTVSAGYANLASQIGEDGERRSVFYSPAARFYLTVIANLDEIYWTAAGRREAPGRAVNRQLTRVRGPSGTH